MLIKILIVLLILIVIGMVVLVWFLEAAIGIIERYNGVW